MKKYAIIIGFMGLLLAGCNKTVPLKMETITVSDKTKDWEIDILHSRFLSSDKNVDQGRADMNQKIQHFIDSLLTDFKTSSHDLFASLEDAGMDRPGWKCSLIVRDTVFIADARYISVRFETYSYLGGANGSNKHYSFNYDIKNQRFLSKEDILDATSQVRINNLLQQHFENPFSCFNETPSFDNVTVVNIASDGVLFTYDQYVLGARVCGDYETFIPKEELSNALKLEDL